MCSANEMPDLDTLDLSDVLSTPRTGLSYECAEEIRETVNAKVRERAVLAACNKCSGKGVIREYGWNKGGHCFACDGTGSKLTARKAKLAAKLTTEIEALKAVLVGA